MTEQSAMYHVEHSEQSEQPGQALNDPHVRQVGGDHYKNLAIQPIEFATLNNLSPCQYSIVKYLTRHQLKGGLKDVQKALHFADFLQDYFVRGYMPRSAFAAEVQPMKPRFYCEQNGLGDDETRAIELASATHSIEDIEELEAVILRIIERYRAEEPEADKAESAPAENAPRPADAATVKDTIVEVGEIRYQAKQAAEYQKTLRKMIYGRGDLMYIAKERLEECESLLMLIESGEFAVDPDVAERQLEKVRRCIDMLATEHRKEVP